MTSLSQLLSGSNRPRHDLEKEKRLLEKNGYLWLTEWQPNKTTFEVAQSIGNVIDIAAMMPGQGISIVQKLQPKERAKSSGNHYSGRFGLSEFPLHSDLAHWAVPPRYVLLRCIKGVGDVFTNLFPSAAIGEFVDERKISRAWFRPRRVIYSRRYCALPLQFCLKGEHGIRWDSVFLIPANLAVTCPRFFGPGVM